MRTILVCGAGPSYGATLSIPHERWAVNWRGGEPKPDLNVTADHLYSRKFAKERVGVELVSIPPSRYPYMTIDDHRTKLGFSGPLAVWLAFERGADQVVLTGTELACVDGSASQLYRLQIPCWQALANRYKGRFWIHPECRGGLDGILKVFSQA